jgi:protein arginine kinase activator
MICEKCHQREALVKFTQVIGDEKKTLNLCTSCMEKQGLDNPMIDISKVFGKIIVALLSEHLISQSQESVTEEDKKLICPVCHLSWADFKKMENLGCPNCYKAFSRQLNVLLRRIHGNNKHFGSNIQTIEKTKESIPILKKKLKEAVQDENYEMAAELRDRIRLIERNRSRVKFT